MAIMGRLLERAIEAAHQLSEDEQEAIGAWLLAEIESELADPAAYAAGNARAADLGREQAQLRERLAEAESELLSLYEAAA